MAINNSQRAGFPAELSATMSGSFLPIGTLLYSPVQIIFDNQGTAAVSISIDGGTTTWRTFPAGEAIILDMRGNHGIAPNFTMDQGTTFYGNGASGVFSISYLYAQNT
jgi:hypothetical protein